MKKIIFLVSVFLFTTIETREINVSGSSTSELDLSKYYEELVNNFTSNSLTGTSLNEIT